MASMLYQHLPAVIGIVGCGQMGQGIAQACALKGMDVIFHDHSQHAISHGMSNIQRLLDKQVKKGTITTDGAHTALKFIRPEADMDTLSNSDFVLEAVTEDEKIKKALFRKLDQITPLHTILASNTSSISITRIARETSRPHRVVGMHFTHPVVDHPLVQIVKGTHTSSATFNAAKSLAEHLGKTLVVSEDRPGFLIHRVMMPLINEAFFCLQEGVGNADDVDRGLRLGLAAKTGPLRLADNMGLDTCLNILRVLHQNLGDPKYRPCPLLAQYVDAGWLGVKTGRGVFQYERDRAALDGDRPPRERHT